MKTSDREIVFNKFGGKCAYCGTELVKGWHVDEVEPVRRYREHLRDEFGNKIWNPNKNDYETKQVVSHPERFNLDNQNPSCASCNINKHSESLEDFRKNIKAYMKHLNEINTQYKIAKRYGLVTENNIEVKFYFETLTDNKPK